MAIDVHCDCGNVYTVGVELSGKKLRCKTCNVVLKVPVVPVGDSKDDPVPPSEEYEIIKEDGAAAAHAVVCGTCGNPGNPGDSVCLACGASLGEGGPALLPRPALFGIIAAVVLLIVGGIGYTIYRSVHLNNVIAQGRDRLEQGDLGGARQAFDEVLRANKDSVEALDGLVQVGLAKPDWNVVKGYGDRLIAKLPPGPRHARALADVAKARLESSEWKAAEKAARDAQREDPSLTSMDEIVAIALAGSSDKDALEALKKADGAGSRDPRVGLNLAKLTEPTNVHDARVWIDKAASYTDKDASVWNECARLREKDGDKEGALLALKRATDLDAQNAQAHVRLAQAYLDAKNPERALEEAKAAKAISADDPQVMRILGNALLDNNDAAGAKPELEHAEKLAPDDAAIVFLLGKAMVLTGDPLGGIDKLEKALRKNERQAPSWLDAGRLAFDGKQPEKAAQFLEKCLAILPRPVPRELSPEQRALYGEAAVLLVRSLASGDGARERNAGKIEQALRDGMVIDPKRREIYLEAGAQEVELNKNKEALDDLERGLAAVGDDPDLLYKAGDAGIKVGGKDGFTAAVSHLEKLMALKPDYPSASARLEVARRELKTYP